MLFLSRKAFHDYCYRRPFRRRQVHRCEGGCDQAGVQLPGHGCYVSFRRLVRPRAWDIAANRPISFGHCEGDPVPRRVFIDGEEVTDVIRTADVDRSVSTVSAHPCVREALLEQQRRIASEGNYVIEGRDIGTVVFPNAELKVFLTASNEERARRRVLQNEQRGVGSVDFEEVLADILRRDELDSSRQNAPLVAAEDALLLDSTGRDIADVIEEICERGARACEA